MMLSRGWAGLTHQNEGVHDFFANLQTSGTGYFQEQITSRLLNLKRGQIPEKNSYQEQMSANAA